MKENVNDNIGYACRSSSAMADTEDSPARKLHFTSSDKVVELVNRGGGITNQQSRLILDQAIATERGGGEEEHWPRHLQSKLPPYAAYKSWRMHSPPLLSPWFCALPPAIAEVGQREFAHA
jgi:hypothetical protein